jgi:hypothetical protein
MKRASAAMRFLVFTIGSLLAAACLAPGGGTDVGNPDFNARVTGSLTYTDGSPAPWVRVHLRPKAFLPNPDSAAATPGKAPGKEQQDGTSDSQGFFTFEDVPRGEYLIEAVDTGSLGAVVEMTADGKTESVSLGITSLEKTGSISGKINYKGPAQPGPPRIIISVYGMERWTLATSSGDFILNDLPPGKYTLYVSNVAVPKATVVPELNLTAGEKGSVGTVDLGP